MNRIHWYIGIYMSREIKKLIQDPHITLDTKAVQHSNKIVHDFMILHLFPGPLFIMTVVGNPDRFIEPRPMEYSGCNQKTPQTKCCSPTLKARDIVLICHNLSLTEPLLADNLS